MAGTPPFQDRRSHPTPALIILDLIMPEVDGYAVLEWLKDHKPTERVPVVVLTSSPDPAAEERSMALGSTAFYRKPDNLDQLGVVVKEIVESYLGEEVIAGVLGSAL